MLFRSLKRYVPEKKTLYLSDFLTLDTKKIYCAGQIVQAEAMDLIEDYLKDYNFPSETAKKLTTISLVNYTAAAILMPYKLFYEECKKQRYDLELIQHTFSRSEEHTSELQSHSFISYAVFCLKKKHFIYLTS